MLIPSERSVQENFARTAFSASRSKWFGLKNPQPLPFYPLKGRLGLYEVKGHPLRYQGE